MLVDPGAQFIFAVGESLGVRKMGGEKLELFEMRKRRVLTLFARPPVKKINQIDPSCR